MLYVGPYIYEEKAAKLIISEPVYNTWPRMFFLEDEWEWVLDLGLFYALLLLLAHICAPRGKKKGEGDS